MRSFVRRDGRQYRLDFPPTFLEVSLPRKPVGRESIVLERQPRKFPRGWFALSLADPDWRSKHYANWSAGRKAAGLPFVVHDLEVA